MNATAFPGLVFRPPVVSPPPTIGAITSAPTGLISSRTRHGAAAATGIPRATNHYGFGRRATVAVPPWLARTHPRAPAPPDKGPPSPSKPTTPQAVPPAQPAQPALRASKGSRSPSVPSSSPPRPQTPEPAVEPDDGLPKPASARPLPRAPELPSLPLSELNDDEPHLLSFVEHFTYTGLVRVQGAEPRCSATIRFLSLHSPAPPLSDPLN